MCTFIVSILDRNFVCKFCPNLYYNSWMSESVYFWDKNSTIFVSVCLFLKNISTIFVSVCLLLRNMCTMSCLCVYFWDKMSLIFVSVRLLLKKYVYNYCVCVSTFKKICLQFSCLCDFFRKNMSTIIVSVCLLLKINVLSWTLVIMQKWFS